MTARIDGQPEQASPDMLRSILPAFAEALMGAQADAECGAQHGQRSPVRRSNACAAGPPSRSGFEAVAAGRSRRSSRSWRAPASWGCRPAGSRKSVHNIKPEDHAKAASSTTSVDVTSCASDGDCLPVLLEGPVEASVVEGAFGAGAAQRLACDTPLVAAPAAGGWAGRATRLRRWRRAVCFLLVSGC